MMCSNAVGAKFASKEMSQKEIKARTRFIRCQKLLSGQTTEKKKELEKQKEINRLNRELALLDF